MPERKEERCACNIRRQRSSLYAHAAERKLCPYGHRKMALPYSIGRRIFYVYKGNAD